MVGGPALSDCLGLALSLAPLRGVSPALAAVAPPARLAAMAVAAVSARVSAAVTDPPDPATADRAKQATWTGPALIEVQQ